MPERVLHLLLQVNHGDQQQRDQRRECTSEENGGPRLLAVVTPRHVQPIRPVEEGQQLNCDPHDSSHPDRCVISFGRVQPFEVLHQDHVVLINPARLVRWHAGGFQRLGGAVQPPQKPQYVVAGNVESHADLDQFLLPAGELVPRVAGTRDQQELLDRVEHADEQRLDALRVPGGHGNVAGLLLHAAPAALLRHVVLRSAVVRLRAGPIPSGVGQKHVQRRGPELHERQERQLPAPVRLPDGVLQRERQQETHDGPRQVHRQIGEVLLEDEHAYPSAGQRERRVGHTHQLHNHPDVGSEVEPDPQRLPGHEHLGSQLAPRVPPVAAAAAAHVRSRPRGHKRGRSRTP
mmetsp:Transcript_57253/g.174316  ORF Transcript_57253/g.174316 Transcript_57253/m.174316 type:complete len:347 (+) Transcript_57253:351-1391(+)